MQTTKQRICDVALHLFQEKGYQNVSLRDIAESAGTTIGNLTHHFPNKGALLAAVQEQLQVSFPLEQTFTNDPQVILERLMLTFFTAEENEKNHSFYYKNIYGFYLDSTQARRNVDSFRRRLYNYYYTSLMTLKASGAVHEEYGIESYFNLAYLCVFMTTFWISDASPYYDETLPTIPIADALYRLFRPYIEDNFLSSWDSVYRTYREKAKAHSCPEDAWPKENVPDSV